MRVKSEFRSKLEAYHKELAPVAIQVFLKMAGIPTTQTVPPNDPQIAALAEQIETLTAIVTFLREHMQALLEGTGRSYGPGDKTTANSSHLRNDLWEIKASV